jgi:hypothetical protein
MWLGKIMAGALVGLLLCVGVAEAAVPTLRHFTSALWNTPERLPTLPETPSIHYQPGALDEARQVAALLPAAMSRVSAMQGRPFAHPVIIGVYTSRAAFAAANGVGTAEGVNGSTFMGRVTLSPALFVSPHSALLATVLTHELSHAHLAGWMGTLATLRLPTWFKEGLAVMVSGGAGAEAVSDAYAREAIRCGDRIVINDRGSLFHLTAIEFEHTPQRSRYASSVQMAYRQASLFVSYLRTTDTAAFARMIQDIENDRPFKDAVTMAYGVNVSILWSRFIAAIHDGSTHCEDHFVRAPSSVRALRVRVAHTRS